MTCSAICRVVARSPELNAGWPQQVCVGTSTVQPASSSSFTAAKPTAGRIRSTRQVTNRPTRTPLLFMRRTCYPTLRKAMGIGMQLKNAMCIEDLRRMARRNVPGVFIDYMEAGSYSQHTRDANVDDMRAIKLRQRVLVDVSQRNLKTTVLGEELAMPLALAPTGLAGMQYADGEILACRAAHNAGIQFCQSTMSICSIEDIGAVIKKPWWFQLYVMRDRGFVKALIERAANAGCTAL